MTATVGDLGGERIKLTSAQRERAELQLAREKLDVLPVEYIKPFMENFCFAIRRAVLTSALLAPEQDKIFKELSSLSPAEIAAAAVAAAKKDKP
ncbi:MAG TPA: hypothetical protein VNT99_11515 [Methylomirabilota bacterium]|nr:hypothetical protein [Methylomirabilota bacterium]